MANPAVIAAGTGAVKSIAPKNENVKIFITLAIVTLVIVIVVMIMIRVFGSIDKVLEAIGLKDSKDKKERDAALANALKGSGDPNSPFNPVFYKTAPSGTMIPKRSTADSLAKQIWDSVGVFYDDSDQAVGAFKQLSNQASVSWLSDVFNQNYKRDLFKWLEDKFDTKEQEQSLILIYDYVSKLPKYK